MDKYYFNTEIAKLINPPLQSKFLQKQKDYIEDLYPSKMKAPLGCTRPPDIPYEHALNTFGASTVKGLLAGDIMYPTDTRTYQSVYSQEFDYRKPVDSVAPAGLKLVVSQNTGEEMKEIFHPIKHEKSVIIVPSSYARKFKSDEKSLVSSADLKNDIFQESVGDCKMKNLGSIHRAALKDRNSVEVLWNLLKMKNHVHFKDLISAFRAYQGGDGKITVSDLQNMCHNMGLSAPLHIIKSLLEECDIIDKDGTLSYEEFIHCLNWKYYLPENSNIERSKYSNDWREGINNPPEAVINNFKTTSSFIGDHNHSVNPETAGIPSYKKEISKSNAKGVSEFNEHGDASSAIQPNSFSKYGVFEEDLRLLHTKAEIKDILIRSGIKCNDETFEIVWHNVNKNGKASIGAVWSVLKRMLLTF